MYSIFLKIFMYTIIALVVFLCIVLIILVLLQRGEGAFSQPTNLYSTNIENNILKKNTIFVITLLVSLIIILNPMLYKTHKTTLNNVAVESKV